jgi:hypothetical protein
MNNAVTGPSPNTLLREVRSELLHLHQTLLNMERRNFERIHGSVTSGELLQLVLNHPQFAWLRTISALVTQIDELLDTDEPAADEEVIALIAQAKQLFALTENEEFRIKYQAALQHEPEVVMVHSALMKLLRSNP